mgnify:CR=1 FL=1
MIQNIIFTLILSFIFFYVFKSKKFGSPLLFIFTGLTFLHSFIYALDEYKREFLSNSIILNIIVLLGILLIRNKATVHEERNIEEFVEKIMKLYKDDSLQKELGENGKRFIEEEFCWEKTSKKLIQLYDQLKN